MDRERWQQVKIVLEGALACPHEERDAYMAAACAGDSELRAEVESLLAASETVGDFIEEPAFRILLERPGSLAPGDRVGPYRVLEVLGSGGMGVVYRAERADGAFEKTVALKVIRHGLDTEGFVRRFEDERQILARLEHPNIARLLDGGTTPDGRPFLVMELIEGLPIDEYCRCGRLDLNQRLELFRPICDAVHFAHQNLVVHRDLKPGNIVVTPDGVPKLLDFGIAKLVGPEQAATSLTELGLQPFTPEFASPEQLRGEPLTTASDVYSLGVLLYEVLTGRLPYRSEPGDRQALGKAIADEDPIRPSSRARRPTEEGSPELEREGHLLGRRLRGDLDNILLMALRKEPSRRYASAEQLAADLHRFQARLPVLATPDGWWYRLRKLVARRRLAVASVSLILALLLVFAVTVTVLLGQVTQERDRAEAVSQFLENLFESPDPARSRGASVTARELLDQGAERIRKELADQPALKADLMDIMGRVYRRLGLNEPARALLTEALSLRRGNLGGDDLRIAESLQNLALVLRGTGDNTGAEGLLREALELQERQRETTTLVYAKGLNDLAAIEEARGDLEAAEEHFRASLALKRRLLGAEHEDIARGLNNLGRLRHARKDLTEAEALYRQALEMRTRLLGPDHPDLAITLNNLAVLREEAGDLAQAEALYRRALELRLAAYGELHPRTAGSLSNLATALKARGRLDEAESLCRRAVAIAAQVPDFHPGQRAAYLRHLADLLLARGRPEEAEYPARESLALLLKAPSSSSETLADVQALLGTALMRQGKLAEAGPLLADSHRTFREVAGEGSKAEIEARERLAELSRRVHR